MAYSIDIKQEARRMRRKGYSLKEISEAFGIAKSTASLWMDDIVLSPSALKKLLQTIKLGQFVNAQKRREKTIAAEQAYLHEERKKLETGPDWEKIVCGMIYWCEGGKDRFGGVRFTNSDPRLVATFLRLFRSSFALDESKFRVCVHLHQYHNKNKQLDFWSKITNINRQQFIRPFLKKNTGKRIRENYQGCVSIYYHNNEIGRKLMAVGKAFLSKYGGVG